MMQSAIGCSEPLEHAVIDGREHGHGRAVVCILSDCQPRLSERPVVALG